MGSRAQAQQLWPTGLVSPQHVGSSRTRDRTRVPCIGRQILNHCATREVRVLFLECIESSFWSNFQLANRTDNHVGRHQWGETRVLTRALGLCLAEGGMLLT